MGGSWFWSRISYRALLWNAVYFIPQKLVMLPCATIYPHFFTQPNAIITWCCHYIINATESCSHDSRNNYCTYVGSFQRPRTSLFASRRVHASWGSRHLTIRMQSPDVEHALRFAQRCKGRPGLFAQLGGRAPQYCPSVTIGRRSNSTALATGSSRKWTPTIKTPISREKGQLSGTSGYIM